MSKNLKKYLEMTARWLTFRGAMFSVLSPSLSRTFSPEQHLKQRHYMELVPPGLNAQGKHTFEIHARLTANGIASSSDMH